ncbi:type 1 periplasmic-binding domain-containing protein [Couchioplanes azureus]|uniref:BMP family ABC transporter substrate-binding protein n=1 Tax=Couchioplanes caeruleus TaxID=56438 RepID=UPI0016716304|nr:BMP family ABC transporter substrate-binding protein [Couchioplanes caeruleus]GGQ44316.1 hypothetical protein GCM10010166_11040 [Couchioplanes caeruleus subsp. azureus]
MDRRLRGAARVRPSAPRFRLPGGRRTRLAVGGAAALLVGGLLAWLWWPESGPDPRSRVYTEATACLLTPAGGVTDAQAAPVWAGMQRASLATLGKVQFLEVDGPQTGENAKTFLATLAAGRCDLVLTAGAAPNAALAAAAATYPNARFVLVGKGSPQGNVSVVDAQRPDQVSAQVEQRVTAVLNAAAGD